MIQLDRGNEGKRGPLRFAAGDLVRHKRYRYRGVVVEADSNCQAAEAWYRSNRTQPRREQPWYHLLVHGSTHTTYAAEENLMAEYAPEEIVHPLLPQFFSSYENGVYVRNDRPWGE